MAHKRRTLRFPFISSTEVINLDFEESAYGFTKELSLFGCFVTSGVRFPQGTSVKLIIRYGGRKFESLGRVAYVLPDEGMGIVFSTTQPDDHGILESWVDELREASAGA